MAKKTITRNPNDFEPIVVNGCLIEPNTTYEVVAKEPSPNSPPVYLELGSVKERFPGVSNTCSLSQYDTGFFSGSPVFNKYDIKNDFVAREKLADLYYETFALPLKIYISEIEKIRVPTDDEFFDSNYPKGLFTVTVGEDVQFNTSNPVDRFRLYIALIEGELAMKGKREDEEKEMGLKDEMDLYNSDAQYAYVSITERKSKKDQQAELELETAYRYSDLLRKDKDLLVDMLNYINIPTSKNISKSELTTLYKTKIDDNKSQLKAFATVIAEYDAKPQEFKVELELLEKLKSKKGRELIRKEGNTFYFGEKPMGSNLKSVVSSLIKDEDLLKDFYIKTSE